MTLVNPQDRIVTVRNLTPTLINQLRLEYDQTLSCPCSLITIPYNSFVKNIIEFHPVCSSIFIDQQWINGLYLPYASTYLVTDFRTTAYSQVK